MAQAREQLPRRRGRRRPRSGLPAWLTAALLPVLVAVGVVVALELAWPGGPAPQGGNAAAVTVPAPSGSPSEVASEAGPPSASPSAAVPDRDPMAPVHEAARVLQLPGPVPEAGTGRFAYAQASGDRFGHAGPLRRYRVAVERGAQEKAADFAVAVDRALGDEQSWTAAGDLRLRRVGGEDRHDFTVYLATAETAGRMCARGGIDISISGRPYTSCRLPGQVVINLDRWRLSVPEYVSSGASLDMYRTYVVNHEVGHELGHGHESCPGAGRPAPVMMQQTLYLNGCVPSPWSHPDGKRYVGPPL